MELTFLLGQLVDELTSWRVSK